ncbi:hypothetical protein SANTM175S_03725 [Streptomyces antimycoticus]
MATTAACQMFRPRKLTRAAPSGRPRMLMFAANQVQNIWLAWPCRSASGTGSMPRVSTEPTRSFSETAMVVPVFLSGGAPVRM